MSDSNSRETVVLVVLDGVGISPTDEGNAFAQADTPVLDGLFDTYPYTELDASGPAVGLPDGYAGNSEVGHLHIGAGRVVPQHLQRINNAIDDGSLFERNAVQDTIEHVQDTGGTVHLMGIASDGGVHGHIDHMLALLEYFGEHDVDVVTHAFLDGRDVPPESAEQYLDQIETVAAETGTGHVGSFVGRFYAMDRDENWERTKQAYDLIVSGDGRTAQSVSGGMHTVRNEDRNDYFTSPAVIESYYAPVGDGDVIMCTNYRKDRIRQLAAAFTNPAFDRFETAHPDNLRFISMTPYGDRFDNLTVMEEITVKRTLGEIISENKNKLQQLRLTESQKRPHVTYFFDGQRELTFPGVGRHIIPSADVDAYDEKPAMEAEQITDYAVDAMEDGSHEFILVNYPNGDLVGHTGSLDATITAVETVDRCIGRLVDAAEDYTVVITADHGNCEVMVQDGEPYTAHTRNQVPFCVIDDSVALRDESYGLSRVAPTVLDLLNITVPDDMEDSLIDDR